MSTVPNFGDEFPHPTESAIRPPNIACCATIFRLFGHCARTIPDAWRSWRSLLFQWISTGAYLESYVGMFSLSNTQHQDYYFVSCVGDSYKTLTCHWHLARGWRPKSYAYTIILALFIFSQFSYTSDYVTQDRRKSYVRTVTFLLPRVE